MTDYSKVVECQVDNAITLYLRETGITQAEMAGKVGLSEVQFSRKRRGQAVWRMDEFVKVCEIVNKAPDEVLRPA